jgi:hypothetical protein
MSDATKKIMPVPPAMPKSEKSNVERNGKQGNLPNEKPAAPDPSPFKLGPT